jgi:hypothetical protein
MSIAIYDILSEDSNNYSEDKADGLTMKILDLARKDL